MGSTCMINERVQLKKKKKKDLARCNSACKTVFSKPLYPSRGLYRDKLSLREVLFTMLRLGNFWSPLQVRGSIFTFSWLPSPFGLPSPPSLSSSSVPRPCLLSSPPNVRAVPRSCQMVPKGPHYLACVPVAEQPRSLLISMPGLLF